MIKLAYQTTIAPASWHLAYLHGFDLDMDYTGIHSISLPGVIVDDAEYSDCEIVTKSSILKKKRTWRLQIRPNLALLIVCFASCPECVQARGRCKCRSPTPPVPPPGLAMKAGRRSHTLYETQDSRVVTS